MARPAFTQKDLGFAQKKRGRAEALPLVEPSKDGASVSYGTLTWFWSEATEPLWNSVIEPFDRVA